VNLRTWYDGLSYAEAIDPLVGATVITPPTVPIGGSTLVTAGVSGTAPFSFQWLSNGVPILNATNQSLTLTNLQLADSGSSYSLVVSNFPFGAPAVATNAAATLTVRAPSDLTWLGSIGAEWNTTDVNWDSNADLTADVAYTDGDRVQFNDAGAQYFITVLTNYYPSRVTVSNEFSEYTLVGPGALAGSGPLIKQGAAGLTLGTDSGHAGGTLIANGTLTVGVGLGAGSVGTGPVTNNGALIINRTGTLAIPGNISGTGGITINTAGANTVGNVILSGANSYSGAVVVSGGTLTLGSSSALGSSPSVTVNSTTAGANGGTRVTLDGGISIPSGKELILNTTFDTARTMVFGTGLGVFTNTWNGPVTINGDGTAQFGSAPNGTLILNGNVTGPATSIFISRGSGANLVVNGTLNLGSIARVQTADGSGIQINSTGNSWATNMFANAGRWTIGANNAIPVGSVFIQQASDSGTLDLNGFNQQILGLDAGVQIVITNSSVLADSTFTFAGGTSTFGGVFSDATRKLNLAVTTGTLVLTNGGSLKLPKSTVTIASGAVLQLDFSATNAVGELVLNGVPQGPGLYSAANRAPFLAGAGALVVLSPNPTKLAYSVAGGTIALTWPGSHLGWLVQSNSVDVANAALWFDIAGSQGATNLNIPISPAQPQVFFRLQHP
jgi:autotransporter-associated beta strand protein